LETIDAPEHYSGENVEEPVRQPMANPSDSSTSQANSASDAGNVRQPAGWLKVAAVAAASGLVGGLAAAWWHRKTLAKLRQEAEPGELHPKIGSDGAAPQGDSAEDV